MSRRTTIVLTIALVLTTIFGVCLLAEVRTVQRPGWFWQIQDKDMLEIGLIGAVGFAFPLIVRFVGEGGAGRGKVAVSLVLLVLLSFSLQLALAFAEKRKVAGLSDRIVRAGHSEFARTAGKGARPTELVRSYEELVKADDQRYARSKPPGQLLIYVLMADLAVKLATFLLPLVAALVILPLFWLATEVGPPGGALWPPLLYVLAPPTALVTLHLDQSVYPLLSTTLWALAARAGRARRAVLAWGAALGALAWGCLFVSFSLLPALLLAGFFAWSTAAVAHPGSDRWGRLARLFLGALLAFLALVVLAWWGLGYDMGQRWQDAMAHHRQWKRWDGTLNDTVRYAIINSVEFCYWLGFPLLALFALDAAWGFQRLVDRLRAWRRGPAGPKTDPPSDPCDRGEPLLELSGLATALLLLSMAVLGTTKSEVARLWIFVIPAVALAASRCLARLPGEERDPVATVVAGVQLLWMFLLKAKQDFR
ncbi:MAG: hypothetical protein HY815_01670 [Candidatus Riflebacteria bacterium]|nr:hypothetical protein [Candidatus Riflebacteria bacterium]